LLPVPARGCLVLPGLPRSLGRRRLHRGGPAVGGTRPTRRRRRDRVDPRARGPACPLRPAGAGARAPGTPPRGGSWPRRRGGMMADMADERVPGEQPRPKAVRTIVFMIAGFVLSLFEFVLIVTGTVVGVATIVIWVGIPILMATTSLVRGFGDLERRWVGKMLDTPLPKA